MKKTLTVLLLVLAITTSLIAGTMAYYTVTLDNLVQGTVTAKDFLMLVKGDSEEYITNQLKLEDLLIAPGETVEWDFTVQNYGDQRITETDLYYRLTFSVDIPEGKSLIEPLVVTVLKGENSEGTFKTDKQQTVDGEFLFTESNNNKQEQTFTVRVHWPHTDSDSAYIGHGYGATIKVDAIAQQAAFDPIEQPVDPETPEEPDDPDDDDESGDDIEEKLIKVLYKIIEQPNPGYLNQFQYSITIKNNSEFDISNWQLFFKLENDILVGGVETQIWYDGWYDGNQYHITPLPNYNLDIIAGNTVDFGGHGITGGNDIPEDLKDLTLSGTIMGNGSPITYGADEIEYTRLP